MNSEKAIVVFAVTTPVIAIMTYAIYHFGYFIYHLHKAISNVTNKFAPIMGPFLLLRMSNFNEIGQESLIKAKHHFVRVLTSALPIAVIFVIGAIVKSNAN